MKFIVDIPDRFAAKDTEEDLLWKIRQAIQEWFPIENEEKASLVKKAE